MIAPRFKRVVSGRELAEVLTPTLDEMARARAKTTTERHPPALVVLLKCYQRSGYFPKLATVPEAVVDHVRGKLGLVEDVLAVHESERTLWRHRECVRNRLDVTYAPAEVRAVAEAAIRKAVVSKDNPADLINVALEELVRARCELPGYTTLDAMATSMAQDSRSPGQVQGGALPLVTGLLSQTHESVSAYPWWPGATP